MGYYILVLLIGFVAGSILMARMLTGKWFVFSK
jgi:hypothetical protein